MVNRAMNRILALALFLNATTALAAPPSERFSVIFGGKTVGHINVDTTGNRSVIDYDYKNNGRGPTMAETVTIGAGGLPTAWTVNGTTTFGGKVSESFAKAGAKATWIDSTGKGAATVKQPSLYIAQNGSPWATGLYARALLADADGSLPALPGGTVKLTKGETIAVNGKDGARQVTRYTISGLDLDPEDVLLDADGAMFGYVTANFAILRAGYEDEQTRLRGIAAKWSTDRFVNIQTRTAHNPGAPLRIRNVRLFDPATKALTDLRTVVVNGRIIAAVEANDSPATPGEASIDGEGGTLIPGMFEMHGHLSQDGALLDLAAGITSVRDMGNDNAVLDGMIGRIEAGTIAGPRVIRAGFIEGKSPYSANNGFVVDSQAKAIDAVRWYASRGYWQIKVYNSMNPAWVPAMVKEAHRLGLRVAGHVPAFSSADAMLEAGYDEITHINQFMLGWVLKPGEDTRQLLRLTALKRLPALDLSSAPVQHTIGMMVDRKIAIDPTLNIHEMLTQDRDGAIGPGSADIYDHMPIGWQRGARQAMIDTTAPGDDAAYRGAFDQILKTTKMLHDRGVFIVFGTDTGGSFTYHRELELYQKAGFTPAEILARATLETARYTGQGETLGSIEKGKLADFFLVPGDPVKDLKAIKTIRMVVKDGTVYFPSEIYSDFGIKPFATAPRLVAAKAE
jgi:imidazolonepropionase-like amidohydrolase